MRVHDISEQASVSAAGRGRWWSGLAVLLLAAVFTGLASRALWREQIPSQIVRERLIMGTTCRLIAVGPRDTAELALDRAWKEMEAVNATMSTYDPNSELSRFNAAHAETDLPLSPGLLAVLRLSQRATMDTLGAFDATVLPLVRLWKQAAQEGQEPTEQSLGTVLKRLGADKFTVLDTKVRKHVEGLEFTLDGIAPGYAVQQAIEVLQSAGLSGGLIDLGGDIACFGRPMNADAWQVAIQDPWSDGHLGILPLRPAPGAICAVSTSGDYRRYLEIGGRRYSHIVDPRTGLPAAQATSVTVLTDNAVTADIWSTALSVLGSEQGLPLCEAHGSLQVLFISGTQTRPAFVTTPSFPERSPASR
ncbi:MAG: FAD:protein FMN transferase [Planctomycetales bacterium]